jgi:Uma2 family endonuclease
MSMVRFEALEEEMPYLELWDGEVRQKMSPQEQHAWLQTGIVALISAECVPRRVARALTELRAPLSRSIRLVPDISVVRWERIQRDVSGRVQNVSAGAPEVAIEIVSPGQSLASLLRKVSLYLENAVPLVLVVDADQECLYRAATGQGLAVLPSGDVVDFAPDIPGFTVTVDSLFGLLRE